MSTLADVPNDLHRATPDELQDMAQVDETEKHKKSAQHTLRRVTRFRKIVRITSARPPACKKTDRTS